MSESLIKIFNASNTLTDSVCKSLIDTFPRMPNKVSTSKSVNIKGHHLSRVCTQIEFPADCAESQLLYSVVDTCYKSYQRNISEKCSLFLPEKYDMEAFRMKKYDRDKGFFDLHVDSNDKLTSNRFIGVLIYCNDVLRGGETVFHLKDKDLTIQPRYGTIVMFPPFWTYPHTALVPYSSDKYIISTYLRYSDN